MIRAQLLCAWIVASGFVAAGPAFGEAGAPVALIMELETQSDTELAAFDEAFAGDLLARN